MQRYVLPAVPETVLVTFSSGLSTNCQDDMHAGQNVCTGSGDPHFISFDGEELHFQGMCTYVMSQPSTQALESGLVPMFKVLSTHETRDGNPDVSWVKEATMKVYGGTYVLGQGKIVTVSVARTPEVNLQR